MIVFLLAVLTFAGAEIASFVLVAAQIGFLWALTILVVASALGVFVVQRVGVGVLARTQERLARREVPTRELLDGVVVLIGGVMICVPGFVGDALGLLLMIRPVRRLVIRVAGLGLARRVQAIRVPTRWATDVRPRAVRYTSPPALGPPDRVPGSGDEADRLRGGRPGH